MSKTEATHKDEYGNTYKVIGVLPKPSLVFYWHAQRGGWWQDLGRDFSHLLPIKD